EQFEDMFKKLIDPYSVAAIIMEPIQGEGGYVVPPVEFVKYVREICDKYGIMLIFDEIQTGFGRTGKMFAQEHFDVKPDIFTSAKAIASGFPLSAVIAKKEHMEKWVAGSHGGTFGGNPVACAAALATIEVLQDGALENCTRMGQYFKEKLLGLKEKHESIGDVRGIGLMLAIELVDEENKPNTNLTKTILTKALEQGLLLLSCGCDKNVVRFIAPTIVEKRDIDKAIEIIDTILSEEEK
ncbi:MAG: aminotransferase class III-fold pyridoxal phosphate-dependent enzyme, partial [Clostridium sp.]|nr:aminotransferase class III-fold pyridoxal phosphate-dependent enzyme [Clostridium sp.]